MSALQMQAFLDV